MIKTGLLVFGLSLLLLAFSPSLRDQVGGGVGRTVNSLMDYSSHRFGLADVSIPFERLPTFSLLVGLMTFVLGFMLTWIVVPVLTALQQITPDEVRGRTFGAFSMITALLTALLIIGAGVMADLFGPSLLVAFIGLVALCFAFFREKLLGLVFVAVRDIMR